jgi:putative nucleotidyltransferase with HDIG domain
LAAFTAENLSTLEKFAVLIGVAMENTRLLSDSRELFIGTVKSLSYAIDAKSPWTAGHSERVTLYALPVGKTLELADKEQKDLELAGLLHDVGKIATQDTILNKPGPLSASEYEAVKMHPVKGAELLAPIGQLQHIIPAIRHHHERYDGTGYPDGLKGADIPLLSRIISIADAFDSMTVERPYRAALNDDEAITELLKYSGSQFDSELVKIFILQYSQNRFSCVKKHGHPGC